MPFQCLANTFWYPTSDDAHLSPKMFEDTDGGDIDFFASVFARAFVHHEAADSPG